MNYKPSLTVFYLVVMFGLLISPAVHADDLSSDWTFEGGVYAYIPMSIEGSSTVAGVTVDLDLGPDEIFDLFQFAIAGRFEGWRDKNTGDNGAFGFVFDLNYVNLGLREDNVGPRSGGLFKVDIQQGIVDMLAGYRFPKVKFGGGSNQAFVFDVTGGARYNYLRQDIYVAPDLPGSPSTDLGGDKHWLEPVIGARGTWQLSDTWDLVLRGDLAGFGVGGDDLTWTVTGLAVWEAWEKTNVRFGYRIYDIDYSEGNGSDEFGYDVRMHGPYIGISHQF
jgi:hypothetical protein